MQKQTSKPSAKPVSAKPARPAMQAKPGKPAAKPVTQAAQAKPETTQAESDATQAKLAAQAKAAQAHNAALSVARAIYNGASPALHTGGNASRRAAILARVKAPKQTARDNNPSTRDESALAALYSNGARAGTCALAACPALDVGIASRLAGLGFLRIATIGGTETATLSETGEKRAAACAARVAKTA